MTASRKRLAAALVFTVALIAGPATLAQDDPATLHPFVPDKAQSSQSTSSQAASSQTASSASASGSSEAPKPKLKPRLPKPLSPTGLPGAPAPASGAPAGVVPAQPQVLRPVTPIATAPAPVAQPLPGAPATFPTVNGAPPAAKPVTTTPTLVSSAPVAPAMHSGPEPITTPISADDIESFTDSVVRTLMQRDHVMGATVAVVQGNTPILLKGYGYDRLSPARRVDPGNSVFRLGSITKVFTWIVARQEIEAGRIKLDSPLADFVPNDVFTEDRRYRPLTLRTVMDHSSGYEDTGLGHLFQLNSAELKGPDSYFRRYKPRRVRNPGEFSSYSNYAPALVARALAQTAQAHDVPSLMEARVFQPLGMDHTSLREPYSATDSDLENLPAPLSTTLTQDLSDGFIWDGATYEAQPFDHAISLSGAVGGSSTAGDMARLMSLMLANGQLDGVQLFNADSAHAFRTPMLKMPEGYNGWASGLMIRTAPSGYATFGHGGSTLWFNSNMVLVPDLNLGIFISTNTQTGGPLAASFPNLLLDHLTGDIVRAPLSPTPDQAYAQHKDFYDSLRGKYVSTRRAYGGLEGAITRLINTVEVSVDRDGRLILSTQNGQSAFVPASAQGFFNPQDSEDPGPASTTGGLHFLYNANGNHVAAFETAANTSRYERIDWFHSPDTLKSLTVITIFTCIGVFVSLILGNGRNERPTEEQARASIVSAGIAALWLVAIFVFNNWWTNIQDDISALFTHWPAGEVKFASCVALIASLGTLFQFVTYYYVYNEQGRYNEGWPEWRKYAHAALVLYWSFYAIVLVLWGAIPPLD